MTKLTDAELALARRNLLQAKASLACEGLHLTAAEDAMFRDFEEQHLSHDERRRRIWETLMADGLAADAAE